LEVLAALPSTATIATLRSLSHAIQSGPSGCNLLFGSPHRLYPESLRRWAQPASCHERRLTVAYAVLHYFESSTIASCTCPFRRLLRLLRHGGKNAVTVARYGLICGCSVVPYSCAGRCCLCCIWDCSRLIRDAQHFCDFIRTFAYR
jgi:hypothetical protein